MRYGSLVVILALWSATAWAQTDFDPKYGDYNIFNPASRYQPDNPLNPANTYAPNSPFNPANRYNLNVPFAPLDGGSGTRKMR